MRTKKMSLKILCIIACFAYTQAQEPNQADAPLSEAFTNWQTVDEEHSRSIATSQSGLIPSPTNNYDFLRDHPVIHTSRAALPLRFDLRDSGYISSVKNQGKTGNCWAFTTIAALEGTALREKVATLDLSEKNLRNRTRFDRDLTNGLINDGGNSDKSIAYLTRGEGPALENDDPFDDIVSVSPHFSPRLTLGESRVFVGSNAIKQALTTVGPLYVGMYEDDYKFNYGSKTTYYCSGKFDQNHGITLIGWNDTISVPTTPTKGAWLCKNSWGSSWGDLGYFWLSYADQSAVTEAVSFEKLSIPTSGSSIYYYDTLGKIGSTGYGKDSAYAAISIKIRGNETITAVGSYFVANNCRTEISLYTTRNNSSGIYSFTNKLISVKETFAESGYYTVTLPQPVPVNAGDSIHVVVKYVTPGYTYPIPTEDSILNYSSQAKANPQETFISSTGNSFSDVGTGKSARSVAIKVVTQLSDRVFIKPDLPEIKAVSPVGRSSSAITCTLQHPSQVGYTISNLRGQIVIKQNPISVETGVMQLRVPSAAGVYVVQLNINGETQNFVHTIH